MTLRKQCWEDGINHTLNVVWSYVYKIQNQAKPNNIPLWVHMWQPIKGKDETAKNKIQDSGYL